MATQNGGKGELAPQSFPLTNTWGHNAPHHVHMHIQ